MAYLVRQCQLRYFGRHSAVVIHKSYDAGVQGSLGGLIHAGHCLGISLIFLADTARRAGRGRDPSKPEGTSGEIPVGKA
jgi:hypothetical protein